LKQPTSNQSVDNAAAHVTSEFGRLNALINNTAIGSHSPDVIKRFQECLTTNVTGPAVVAAAFGLLLLKSAKPYSLFVRSGAGSIAKSFDPNEPIYRVNIPNGEEAYRISKAVLNMLALQEPLMREDRG
jgi:NAD(P)-dependent dehydrogenase (short-subunit alcohol dehydrogenase family)